MLFEAEPSSEQVPNNLHYVIHESANIRMSGHIADNEKSWNLTGGKHGKIILSDATK